MTPHSRGAACARVLPETFPLEKRGSRECRVHAAPAVSCAKCTRKNAHEHTGSAEAIRHSLRNGFTAYGALSPEYRAFLPPSSREYGFVRPVGLATPPRDLTPTTEASGPHAFAVRSHPSSPKGSPGKAPFVPRTGRSLTRNSPCDSLRADAAASTASPPAFVTIAIRPSCRERTGRACKGDLPDMLSEILPVGLFCRRLGAACRSALSVPAWPHRLAARRFLWRFSAAGMQVYTRAEAAGGRKAPRHEVAGG
jgi:hypothetical protein